jgi:hypothetical protein
MRHQLASPHNKIPSNFSDIPELNAFFELADQYVESSTGLWRPLIKRMFQKHPHMGDFGGAAHFLWLYDRLGHKHPNPSALIQNALPLQKSSGLFKDKPFCIDLDFTHLFYYAARISPTNMDFSHVDMAMLRNGRAILDYINKGSRLAMYSDSHGLPGALCSLAQIDAYLRWRGIEQSPSPTFDVFSVVCWI